MDRCRRWACLCAVMLGMATLLVGSSTASAHTDFESSSPAQGDVVVDPVSSVVLVFSADTQPVDDLVVALDPDGVVRPPTGVTTEDDRTFTATFDPPLAGGDVGIRWTVLGADGHPLEGAFSFTVTAPVPTTATPVTVPATPAPSPPDTASSDNASPTTVQPTTVQPTEPTSTEPVTASVSDAEPADDEAGGDASAADDSAVGEAEVVAPAEGADAAGDRAQSASPQSLDEFLAVDPGVPGGGRRLAGRLLSIPAIAVAIGALGFLVWSMRGSADEISGIVTAVRIAGVVVGVGAVVHYLGSIASTGESFATGWSDTPGFAMAVRLLGALVLVVGLRATTSGGGPNRATVAPPPRPLSAAVIDADVSTDSADSVMSRPDSAQRWDASASRGAFIGAALLVASFWFDGHTVTEGWRPLHAVVNSVHVVAGSIWFGGVVTLAAIAWWRRRRGDDARLSDLVVRFSSVATVALAAVVVAGFVLAVVVLDGLGELTGTEWGRMLLLKTAAVGSAILLGAYNHFRLRPALVAAPDDVAVRATLRSVLTAEAIVLTFVVVVTCWLVAAAT